MVLTAALGFLLGVLSVALGAGAGGGVTQPMIDAIAAGGQGILGPIGVFLGILVTVSIGFAIVRAVRG